jgi:hypothetical protein
MAKRQRLTEKGRPIMGGALVGLGLHLLFGNLDRDAAQLGHILGIPGGDGLGVLPSIVLAASQAGKAFAVDQHGFWLVLLRMLLSLWPLLPVITGIMFLREAVTEKARILPAPVKYLRHKDSGCRFPCPSFDL